MKYIKSIITIAGLLLIASIVVWHLMWMKDIQSTSDVTQLLEEAKHIAEVTDHETGDVRKPAESSAYVPEMEAIPAQQSPTQIEQMEEHPQEEGVPEEINIKRKLSQPQDAFPVPERAYEEREQDITREETDRQQDNQQHRFSSGKVQNVTIKGSTQMRTMKPAPANISNASPAQHPTSTAP